MLNLKISYLLFGSLLGFFIFYLISKGFSKIDCTHRDHNLTEGAIFRVGMKKVFLVHVFIWALVFWLVGGIIYFESKKAPISQVLSEWKYLLLFATCFFLAIDVLLHVLLIKMCLCISMKEVRYNFSFRTHSLFVAQIVSIEHLDEKYRIKLISGVHFEIPDYALIFLEDSEKAKKILLELGTVVKQLR